jgi:hypothetical protein
LSHFGDETWADFARGASPALERDEIQSHLDRGCSACSVRRRLWDSVTRLAGREASYHPPAGAVRQAKAHFAPRRPSTFLERVSKTVSLVFDSMSAPVPVGVRTAGPSSRRLLYEDGRRVLRVSIEKQDDCEALSVVGQVIEAQQPERGLPTLPVRVQSGRRTMARTLTNQFGEFELEFMPTTRSRLVVGVPGKDALSVSLPIENRRTQKAVAAGSLRRG